MRFDADRAFATSERRTLLAFARIAAGSVLRARENERVARRRVHSELLAEVTTALQGAPGVRGRLERLAAALVPAWADGCRIDPPGEGAPVVAARDPDVREALAGMAGVGGEGDGHLGRRVAEATSAPLPAGDGREGRIVLVARQAPRGVASLPVGEIGRRAGVAVDNARLYEAARDVATTLQRSLLPVLPELRDLAVSARYVAAAAHTEAGGDWYEAIELAEQRVFLAVGDVVGRGTVAASVMGQLRSAARAYALAQMGPAATLRELSTFAASVPGASVSTAACACVDLRRRLLTYACAGHPPPLALRADGETELLRDGRGPALGVGAARYVEATIPFEIGDCLLLFTDGLVERRDERLDDGLDRLAAAAREGHGAPPEELADRLLAALVGDDASTDDVALLVARAEPSPEPMELCLPAVPANLAVARAALRDWLEGVGGTRAEHQDVVLATGEALSNGVEHAYPDNPGDVVLTAELDSRRAVSITVRDRGRWRTTSAAPGGMRGRGLPIIRSVMDQVRVDQGEGGTAVNMRRRLTGRPAGPGNRPAAGDGAPPTATATATVDGGRIVVSGDLDAETVGPLRERVLSLAGGPDPVVLDLSGVTYIDSTGAQLVGQLARRSAPRRPVVAFAEGGPVERVLQLTGLDAVVDLKAAGPPALAGELTPSSRPGSPGSTRRSEPARG